MHFRRKPKHESGITCQTHKVYSLTCEDFDALWKRSGGNCEACGQAPQEGPRLGLVIDHDHHYGNTAVRGLICRWCNTVLGQLENPDIHPPFGSGPGGCFRGYFQRAWFMRNQRELVMDAFVDRERLGEELRRWKKYNKALFSSDPKAALVPLDQPSVVAEILRAEMSPQAFGALVRAVNKLRETPKQSDPR